MAKKDKAQPKAAGGKTVANMQKLAGNFPRELPVKLTDQELKLISGELAADELLLQRIKDEKSAALTAFGARIKEVGERIAKNASAVDTGETLRMVDCYWHEDLKKHSKQLRREDTLEVIDERAMTSDELQTNFV